MNNIILKGFEMSKILSAFSTGQEPYQTNNPARIVIDTRVVKPVFDQLLTKTISEDNTEPIYEYREDQGRKVQVYTTQANMFIDMVKSDGSSLPVNGICSYHCLPFEGQCYGYPVDYEELRNLVTDEFGNSVYQVKHLFHVQGMFCGFRCALAYLNMFLSGVDRMSTIARKSRTLLLQQFSLMYPGQKLEPVKDRFLLSHLGGHMNLDEWFGINFPLYPMVNIIYSPSKLSYVRIEDRKVSVAVDDTKKQEVKAVQRLPLLKANGLGTRQFNGVGMININ